MVNIVLDNLYVKSALSMQIFILSKVLTTENLLKFRIKLCTALVTIGLQKFLIFTILI